MNAGEVVAEATDLTAMTEAAGGAAITAQPPRLPIMPKPINVNSKEMQLHLSPSLSIVVAFTSLFVH
jgi:hypothetical protein